MRQDFHLRCGFGRHTVRATRSSMELYPYPIEQIAHSIMIRHNASVRNHQAVSQVSFRRTDRCSAPSRTLACFLDSPVASHAYCTVYQSWSHDLRLHCAASSRDLTRVIPPVQCYLARVVVRSNEPLRRFWQVNSPILYQRPSRCSTSTLT